MTAPVPGNRRFGPSFLCPICSGHAALPRHRGKRCNGFLSADGRFARCSREEFAGGLPLESESGCYVHLLAGACKCGQVHGAAPPPIERPQRAPRSFDDSHFADCEKGSPWDFVRMDGTSYRKARHAGKNFQMYHRSADRWEPGRGGPPALLDEPMIREAAASGAHTVVYCEGEFKARELQRLGFKATTPDVGAPTFRDSDAEPVRGAKRVAFVLDNDAKGRDRGDGGAFAVWAVGVRDIRLWTPPVSAGQGVDDFLAAQRARGLSDQAIANEIRRGIGSVPTWRPPVAQESSAAPFVDPGARVEAESAPEEPEREESGKAPPQATQLFELAKEHEAELFVSPNGVPMASVRLKNRRETWPVRSSGFRTWLARQFRERTGRIPRAQALTDAVGLLHGEAAMDGQVHEVHVRFAAHGEALYLDLADEARRIVEVTAGGWRIVSDAPVRFRRARGMLALPVPVAGGTLEELLGLLNVREQRGRRLILAWALSTLQPGGALPLLVVTGEQGSGKTLAGWMLKQTIDPSSAPLRAEPREVADLMIAANNSRIAAFDNLSAIPAWLSDALCRLSTGGGLGRRELYSDDEEHILEARRPVILTGIEDLASRPDLLDRVIIVQLEPIAGAVRRTEEELCRDFERAHPTILGALLDAAAAGLRNRERVRLSSLPRMADFARWIAACAPALGLEAGELLLAYAENRRSANAVALEASPIGPAVLRLVAKGNWEGTATELLARLGREVSEETVRHKSWPKNGRHLSGALRRIASNLRMAGVTVDVGDRDAGRRTVRLTRTGEPAMTLDDASVTLDDASPDSSVIAEPVVPHAVGNGDDANDASDARKPTLSAHHPRPRLAALEPFDMAVATAEVVDRLRGRP